MVNIGLVITIVSILVLLANNMNLVQKYVAPIVSTSIPQTNTTQEQKERTWSDVATGVIEASKDNISTPIWLFALIIMMILILK